MIEQPVAPLVDGEAELVGRPEPLLAGRAGRPTGYGCGSDGRRPSPVARPARPPRPSTPTRPVRSRPGAWCDGSARVPGQGEPQLVEEGQPALLDVVVVEVPVDAAADRRSAHHLDDGFDVMVVEAEEVTADVKGAGVLPRLGLLLEDGLDLLGQPLVVPAEPLRDHLGVAERLPHRLERRRQRDLDADGLLVGQLLVPFVGLRGGSTVQSEAIPSPSSRSRTRRSDLVADRPHLLDALAGRVGELPVLVALAREDRAGVAAAHA